MPKRGAFALGLTAIALVLLLNFQTPTVGQVAAASPGTGVTGGVSVPASPRPGGSTTASGARTVTGPVVNTRWGAVQVEVTLDGSTLVDVKALQLPDGDRRSSQISSRAEPVLRSEALQANSANIDGLSGATYTSVAYARSLQAALDTAGI